MATKTAVSLANILMLYIETQSLNKTVFKPTVWKRYTEDIFSVWDIYKPDVTVAFFEQGKLALPYYQIHHRNSVRQCFQTQLYTKTQDSTKKLSLM